MEYRVGKFYCTDDDCYQYCKEISPVEYQFTQIQRAPSNSGDEEVFCVTASEVINVADMDIDDVKKAICGFYNSFAEMIEDYSEGMTVDGYLELIAECYFENKPGNVISKPMTMKECVRFQYDWMLMNS